MHVVDLDAATGRGDNSGIVRDILEEVPASIQVGGGVRSGDVVERLLQEGASWVVLGTRALEEPEWLAGTASTFPGQLIVAADVRERQVVTRGWSRTLARGVLDVVEQLNDIPLGGVLVTAVHREGQLAGTDLLLMEDVVRAIRAPGDRLRRHLERQRSSRARRPGHRGSGHRHGACTRARSMRVRSRRNSHHDGRRTEHARDADSRASWRRDPEWRASTRPCRFSITCW